MAKNTVEINARAISALLFVLVARGRAQVSVAAAMADWPMVMLADAIKFMAVMNSLTIDSAGDTSSTQLRKGQQGWGSAGRHSRWREVLSRVHTSTDGGGLVMTCMRTQKQVTIQET